MRNASRAVSQPVVVRCSNSTTIGNSVERALVARLGYSRKLTTKKLDHPRLRGRVPLSRNLFDLSGKVALVTGGSKGLGKSMARALAEAGADIVISSRHENELKSALEEILRDTGRKGRYVVADMSKRPEASRLARASLDLMGRV